jgi:hypothetical protein
VLFLLPLATMQVTITSATAILIYYDVMNEAKTKLKQKSKTKVE